MAELTFPDVPRVSQNTFFCYSRLQRSGLDLVIPSAIPCATMPSVESKTGISSASGGLSNEYISISPKVFSGELTWQITGKEQFAHGDWSFGCTIRTKGNATLSAASVHFTFHVKLRPMDDVFCSAKRFFLAQGEQLEYTSVVPSSNNPMIDCGASTEGVLRSSYSGTYEHYEDSNKINRTRWLGDSSGLTVKFIRSNNSVTDIQLGGVAETPGLYFFWVYRNTWSEGGQYDRYPQTFPAGCNAVPVLVEVHSKSIFPKGSLAIRNRADGAIVPYSPPVSEKYSSVEWGGLYSSYIVRDKALKINNFAQNASGENTPLSLHGYAMFTYFPAVRLLVPLNGAGGGVKPDETIDYSVKRIQNSEYENFMYTYAIMTVGREEVSTSECIVSGSFHAGNLQHRDGPEVWFWEDDPSSADITYRQSSEVIVHSSEEYRETEMTEIVRTGDMDVYGFLRIYPISCRTENAKHGIYAVPQVRVRASFPAKEKYKKERYNYGDTEILESSESDTTESFTIDGQSSQLCHLMGASVGTSIAPDADEFIEGTMSYNRSGGFNTHDSSGYAYVSFSATWKGKSGDATTTIKTKRESCDETGNVTTNEQEETVDDPTADVFRNYVSSSDSAEIPKYTENLTIWDDTYTRSYSEDLYIRKFSS